MDEQERKIRQGYRSETDAEICTNCRHFSNVREARITKENFNRCTLGDFKALQTGFCDEFASSRRHLRRIQRNTAYDKAQLK